MINASLKNKISAKLDEIAEAVLSYDHKESLSISYLGGLSGVLPFLFDYGHYKNDERFTDLAENYIYDMVGNLESNNVSHLYSSGIAGFAWVLEWLAEQEYVEKLEVLHPFDTILCNHMLRDMSQNNWDALHGAIGVSFYLFKRIENPEVKTALENLVLKMEEKSEKSENGTKWQNLDYTTKAVVYNFGLAHGMPSIMIFLAKCVELNIHKDKSKAMLMDLIRYFKEQKSKNADHEFIYPNTEEGHDTGPRLAWCYGDLGITVAFQYVNEIVGGLDDELAALIKDLLTRRNLKASRINDAGFCHGASSVAHIYQYLMLKGHKQIKVEDIEYWLESSLALAVHPDGFGGYKAYMPSQEDKNKDPWEKDIGLLTGSVGIASVYLSILNDNLSWSKGLMLF